MEFYDGYNVVHACMIAMTKISSWPDSIGGLLRLDARDGKAVGVLENLRDQMDDAC